MRILFDLHTHTVYSRRNHGKGTVEENVRTAREKGIGIALSDHGPGHAFYGVLPHKYEELKAEIDRENDRAGKKVALLGVEANLMDWQGRLDCELLPYAPEVLLCGFHKGFAPLDRAGRKFWREVTFSKYTCRDHMTDAICLAMERYEMDVLTHPGEYIPVNIRAVARVAARCGVALEINDRHGLSAKDIAAAAEEGAYFVLGSDAHRPHRVGEIRNALAQAQKAALPENRIVNSDAYQWNAGLRIDRIHSFVDNFTGFSTDFPQDECDRS